jgi:hypothetical protein
MRSDDFVLVKFYGGVQYVSSKRHFQTYFNYSPAIEITLACLNRMVTY